MGAALSAVFGTGGISRVLVLAGLVLGVVGAVGFLRGSARLRLAVVGTTDPTAQWWRRWVTGPARALVWPLFLVWLGFWIASRGQNLVYGAVVGLAVAALVLCAVFLLRRAHARRGDHEVAPAALAAVLAGGLVLEFGLLLTVRLVVLRNPATKLAEGLARDVFTEARGAVFLPLVLLLALVAVPLAVGANRLAGVRRAVGGTARRVAGGARRVAGWPAVTADRSGAGRRGGVVARARWWSAVVVRLRWWGAVVLVFAVFAAAWFDKPDRLLIAGVAASEYGKVLYLALLAALLAGFAHRFGRSGQYVRGRGHFFYPIALFGAVCVGSFVRSDLGPLIGLFAVTVVLMLFLVADGVRRSSLRHEGSRWRRWAELAVHTRWYLVVLAGTVLVGAVAFATFPKATDRVEAMVRPWEYGWTNTCVEPPEGAEVPDAPDGAALCRLPVDGEAANRRSQIAQGLAAIADGGLWGRGLPDTASGQVPLGESDLVIAVIWSKLGGVVVLLMGALLALLATALARLAREAEHRSGVRGPTAARLFAIGVAALLVVQFGYVFLATIAWVPHSGFTVPFLSRGGQSTLALGAAVVLTVWWSYRLTAPNPPGGPPVRGTPATGGLPTHRWDAPAAGTSSAPRRGAPARLLSAPLVLVVAVCLVGGAVTTAWPYRGYATDRPYCRAERPRENPEKCSTDRIALHRHTVVLSVGGVPQYTRDRTQGTWEAIGTPVISQEDLGGLVGAGDQAGAVDGALGDLVDGSSALANPLLPAGESEPGAVELTVDPDLQRAAVAALRDDGAGGPLAGGVVVLEPDTGRVLAAASAPGHVPAGKTAAAEPSDAQRREFERQHPAGVFDGTRIDEQRTAECRPDDEVDNTCWQWQLLPGPGEEPPESRAERRRYVDGRDDVRLPSTSDNRALRRNYGLGSTFKVVVAAAYLRQPGKHITDRVPAPAELPVRGRREPVKNSPRGLCERGESGTITVADALAVSCNTAFVRLAMDLPWPLIRDTAVDFGFRAVPADAERAPAWVAGTELGVDSRVPPESEGGDLANSVLGGGHVEGTPLHLAAVLGGIANGGKLVQPRLVDATTRPHGGPRAEVVPEVRQVLSTAQAAELLAGLAGTVEFGTAERLAEHPGHELRVKTGTHDLHGGEDPPPGEFTRQIAWLVGSVTTARGPVAFAVAVETADEGRGAARARLLTDAVVGAIVEERG
ncbi:MULTISPECIES: penicillin-binding transpeptidase domain-containing protein [unclassified Saccharothrix]|uniref:penicillin-binding transpeptidase domain-containing protein n=1 Tax=unclassified Saccharothrix TaxID=2593673 RepID=UPI00307D722B